MGTISPALLLRAYGAGLFPMAEGRGTRGLHWMDPDPRGILPLDGFRVSRSLRRRILRCGWEIGIDRDFAGVLDGCADRPETWINAEIRALYLDLHAQGHAHSLELREAGALVGGVYGVAQGGAFFAESMFSRRTDASKVALAYLVDRLRAGGFVLMDTQFMTPHLASLGGQEIPRRTYRRRLAAALALGADFRRPAVPDAQELMQRSSQTS